MSKSKNWNQNKKKYKKVKLLLQHSLGGPEDEVSEGCQCISSIFYNSREKTILRKKTVYDSSHLATLNQLEILRVGLSFSDCSSWASRPDTWHNIQEFLTTILSIDIIALEIDQGWDIFFSHFFSVLIEQVINRRKMRSENLKCRTDL